MNWEVVTHEPDELTERLAVDGGYLYRTVREVARGIGQTPLVGAALVFVPGVALRVVPQPDPRPIAMFESQATETV